ncbi:MAG: 2-oxo acid dehydrogenase subunit E2 [Solirubrobacterales bacterium]|nr:2-oxo acid dehydrogenase subunit E2 [Solirubrobacterales bacterium]
MSSSRTDASVTLVDVRMPQMGVSVAEGTVVAWRVEVGDRIAADQTICEISTDKIDTEVPAPVAGVLAEVLVPVESTVSVGTVLARIAPEGAPVPQGAAEPASGALADTASNGAGADTVAQAEGIPAPALEPSPQRPRYSPVVQRIAAEHGVDLSQITGTGRGGRVRKQDVLAFLDDIAEQPPLHIESPYRPEPVAAGGQLSRMRRQIGEHMKRSLETAAHCTTWIEVDMSRIEAARASLGVTALPFVARATVAALREHPALNAWLEGERYTRHPAINLGIAVSLGDDGLIVPVVSAAHELSVEGLAARIKELARRARSRELAPDEVRGGTFTITNPGQYGSIMATPIINQPQVAILDLEAIVKHPVVVTDADGNDSIAIRPTTILGLSWDHRALDGAQAAQFLATLKRHLEHWTGA